MRRLPIRLRCALLDLPMLACGSPSPIDAGPPHDAGTHDAGNPIVDAGTPDAGAPDAGTIDSGVPDSGTVDAGPVDCNHPERFVRGTPVPPKLPSAAWINKLKSAAGA